MSQNPESSSFHNINPDSSEEENDTSSNPSPPAFDIENVIGEIFTLVASHPPPNVAAIARAASRRREASGSSSRRRPRRHIERDREGGQDRLMHDYFADQPVYPLNYFRRRFRMQRHLFNRVVQAVEAHDPFFRQRPDALGRPSISATTKCTAALRQLAYGGPSDALDEYLRMGESTAIECLKHFCLAICEVFGPRYLRKPTADDIQRLYHLHETKHGFPGMLGSIDCMHWKWRNCPVAWKGMYTRGDKGVPTLMLEAVASHDLWIWHAFFGVAGSNNDINVLNQSDVFTAVLRGQAAECPFEVNGRTYPRGYYLADGIYPDWSVFVKSYSAPQDPKRILFKQRQESARKDVERAFGVLQARWGILRTGARFWYQNSLKDIMYCCIILHNMIIEDEGEEVQNWSDDEGDQPPSTVRHGPAQGFSRYIDTHADMQSREKHHQLRSDLIEHICANVGDDGSAF